MRSLVVNTSLYILLVCLILLSFKILKSASRSHYSRVINFNSLNKQVYHIILCHLSPLKLFLKIQGVYHIIFLDWKIILKIKKSRHATSPFSIEKIILKIQIPCHITSCHITFLY
jgi:hypothetical protein